MFILLLNEFIFGLQTAETAKHIKDVLGTRPIIYYNIINYTFVAELRIVKID